MQSQINEIKSKLDIVDFISPFVTLKKTGRNFKGLCPFHEEKTPSFIVSPERQIWHCFGACQEGGDIVKFLMKWENITFYEALKELAKKTGIKLKTQTIEDKQWKIKEKLLAINTLSAKYFQHILHNTTLGKKALTYLSSRSINKKVINTFQLGYAPNSWDSLLKYLIKKGFSKKEIISSGLMVQNEKGNIYDRFRGRLVFPLKDSQNNVIGFSGRTLNKKKQSAKYINTPETLLYKKRKTLFGINIAKDNIKKKGEVIIVEGEFDVITPFQHGIDNIVAIKGSALTKDQLLLIKRLTNKIILALDTDQAGVKAIEKGFEKSEKLDIEMFVIDLDFAKDPDEAVRKHKGMFEKKIKSPQPIYDFIINKIIKNYNKDQSLEDKPFKLSPFDKKRMGNKIVPFISKIQNPIIKSFYINKLAQVLDVDSASIKTLLRKQKYRRIKPQYPIYKKQVTNQSRETIIQKYLLSYIFQNKDPFKTGDHIFKIITIKDFSVPSYQKIINRFLSLRKKENNIQIAKFVEELPPELRSVFDEIYLFASLDFDFNTKAIDKLTLHIKKNSLKRQISSILSIEASKDQSTKEKILLDLTKELKIIEKKLTS